MSDPLLADFAAQDLEVFAATLGQGSFEELLDVLNLLPAELAAAVVARLPQRHLGQLVSEEFDQTAGWLDAAGFDDAAALLARLPREQGFSLVSTLRDARRAHRLRQFLHYPSHCIGAVVSPVQVQVLEEAAVAEVVAELADVGGDVEVPTAVLDSAGRFRGKLNIWKLLVRRPQVGHARDYVLPMPTLRPESNLGNARDLSYWHDHLWLPVVDYQDRLLGSVSRVRIAAAAAEFDDDTGLLVDSVVDVGSQLYRVSGDLLTRLLTDRSWS